MTPTEQDKELRDKISSLLADDYACTRVWEAWQVGTMAENDFIPLSETERVDEFMQLITADRKRVELGARIDENRRTRG